MSDNRFFLHHYEASPYAEKIRGMFGLTGLRWNSVLSPPFPPRPNVDPLAGGYRRIPVAHLGADVFCDTALIATEVATLTGRGELAPLLGDAAVVALVERAEGPVFFSAITSAPPLKLLGKLLLSHGPRGTLRFVRDRTGMMRSASVRPPQGKEAAGVLDEFLADLDHHLADRQCMDGVELGYADFCVYHPVWLALSVGSARTLERYANVNRWLARMEALGQGNREEATPEQAFTAVERAEPRALPDGCDRHEAVGSEVAIAPDDYGKVAVRGMLVGATDDRYILARSTDRVGTVHVHFPREGYELAQ